MKPAQKPTSPTPLSRLSRVVLVDDNPVDNEFHTIILRKAGFLGEVLAFETGEEAIAHFRDPGHAHVDLMLLDINLPGANGFETARALMNLSAGLPEAVVVMLTSSPDPNDVNLARSIGIVRDYLTKPLTVPAIRELAERCFQD